MPTTSNFGWTTPADTDLVKDGAAAIRTLGNGIDTSFLDLKGGTTGQFLSKNSNTDLDFTWAAAMTNPLTTTGDTIYSSSGSTAARLGIGTAGQVLTVNSGATAPEWATPASGSYTLLSTTTLSGTSTTISSISASYNDLVIYVDNWTLNAAVKLDIRIDSDSGSGRYRQNCQDASYSRESTTEVRPNKLDAATGTQSNNYTLQIFDYANTSNYKTYIGSGAYVANTDSIRYSETIMGTFTSTSAVDSLVIRSSNGTATIGGTVRIYGRK